LACKIKIKEALTNKVEEMTNEGLTMTLEVAEKLASDVNDQFKNNVVEFNETTDDIDYDKLISDMIKNKEITFTNEDNEICSEVSSKPNYKSSFVSSKTLVNSKSPVQNKIIQDGFKSKLKQLNDIANKIWKI
jgi:hypothetical protein